MHVHSAYAFLHRTLATVLTGNLLTLHHSDGRHARSSIAQTSACRVNCALYEHPNVHAAPGVDFSTAEVVFSAIGGLRGAISLILAQSVVTEHRPGETDKNARVTAQVPGRSQLIHHHARMASRPVCTLLGP